MKKTWVWYMALMAVLTACNGRQIHVNPSGPVGPAATNTPTPTTTAIDTSASTATPTATAIPTATLPDFNLSGAVTTLNTGTYNFNCVHLAAGAVVTINGGVTIFCQCFTLDAGATITGLGMGYISSTLCGGSGKAGPGQGLTQVYYDCQIFLAAGGGHGGLGSDDCITCPVSGLTDCVSGGTVMDDPIHPYLWGGSGGNRACNPASPVWFKSAGGGLLKLVVLDSTSNNLSPATINGMIDMTGSYGYGTASDHKGGGAGGTILVEASHLLGNGYLWAKGGGVGIGAGLGGGGIISLIAETGSFAGNVSVAGGVLPYYPGTLGNPGILSITPPPTIGY